jgi:tetratricopeptide (TPR) repeat protein
MAASQRMKLLHFILVFGLAGWLLPACSTALHRTPPAPGGGAGQSAASAPRLQFVKGNADAFAHFAAGESSFDNEDAAGTLRQWEAAALADPSNEGLVVKVAAQLLHDKNTEKALAVLSKSASRTNASALVLAWLARAQLQANHTSQALASSKRAIQRQPGALDGYECQVEILLHDKQWAEAAKTIYRAARQVPADPALLLAVADLYGVYLREQPKDTEAETQALALLDRIAGLKFNGDGLWQRLAEDYTRLNHQKQAAEIFTRLLAEYPEPSLTRDSLLGKLAGLYIQSDDRTNAMKQLKALIGDNPTQYPRAWFVLGELAYQGGDLADAAEDFGNALHWDPSIEQAYYDLALVQLDLHKSQEAFDILERARHRFHNTFACEFYTGIIQAHVKNFSEAIRHFKEAEVIGLASDARATTPTNRRRNICKSASIWRRISPRRSITWATRWPTGANNCPAPAR